MGPDRTLSSSEEHHGENAMIMVHYRDHQVQAAKTPEGQDSMTQPVSNCYSD